MATYNLVYSVKGGCGKTTFSIWMAYYLNMIDETDNETASVLIDMDLLGTSMLAVINGNSESCQTAVTNDIFSGVKNVTKDFVERVKLRNNGYINIIFASMDSIEREKFKSGAGYAPVVRHGIFRSGVRELIKHVQKIDCKNVKHFIFDMPPNSDGFSDAAMECIFDKKYSVAGRGDRKNLFIMIGIDWGQTLATIAELQMLLKHNDHRMPDRIFLVINHNLSGDFPGDCTDRRKTEIEGKLEAFLSEDEKNRIFFLKVINNPRYTQLGVGNTKDGLGLKNADTEVLNNVLPRAVIAAYAPYKEQFQDVTSDIKSDKKSDKLLKLILGEVNG